MARVGVEKPRECVSSSCSELHNYNLSLTCSGN